MELILIYFYQKVKAKTAELDYKANRYVWGLVLLWAVGETAGLLVACKFFEAWWLRYLIGAGCGFIPGWLVYRKVLGLEPQSPEYFDLGSTAAFSYLDEQPEPITEKSGRSEAFKEKNDAMRQAAQTEPTPPSNGIGFNHPEFKPDYRPEYKADIRPKVITETNPETLRSRAPTGFERFETFKEKNDAMRQPAQTEPTPPSNDIGFNHPEFKPDYRPEYKADIRPEVITETNPGTLRSRTPSGFKTTPVETGNGSYDGINRNFFQFPYGELLSLNELIIGEYGQQTVKDFSIAACPWFDQFKAKYENREIKAALMILENMLCEEANSGLIWLLFGILYKDVYQDYDKALQFCLTGAKRCNSYKITLLTEAAELLLLGKKDLVNAFKFFSMAVIAITEESKAWGDPNIDGCIAQERAFHFIRVLLTAFNFTDYRLYLERNIRFSTGLDQKLIENVLSLCAESPFRTEIEQMISRIFPLIIEKLQALA
jgi:hypothetical protein